MIAHYYFVHADKDYAQRVAARIGRPVLRPMRRFVVWLALTVAGGLMPATIDLTSGLLQPQQEY